MNKHTHLRAIPTEAELRYHLVNLFDRMKLEPILTHGQLEHGKDIVCKEMNKLGLMEWIGCVVKLGRISGSTSGKNSIQTIINQVQDVFSHPFVDTTTKQKAPINKVFVINNDEILATARETILEKISALSFNAGANVHFIERTRLAALLDEHWKEFWNTPPKRSALHKPMSPEIGTTLYVVALAYTKHARHAKKQSNQLSKSAIIEQTGLPEAKVESALDYLVQLKYLEPPTDENYTLHRKLAAGILLTTKSHIDLLFLLSKKANASRHLSAKEAKRVAKKSLDFTPDFVKQATELFVRGDYLEVDISRGKNHYKIRDGTLQEEKAYLECWLKYKGMVPEPNRN